MNTLPQNWNEMTHSEQESWFAKFWWNYTADGEPEGLRADAPQQIKDAYKEWLQQG